MSVSRIYRLLRLIMLMRSGRSLDARDLAAELQVSRRTLFRDLKMLELAGVPYRYDARQGGYNISESFFLPPINLTVSEALALLLVTRKFISRQALPVYGDAARAAAKIESSLPASLLSQCGSLLATTDVRWGPLSEASSVDSAFVTLQQAIAQKRKVRIRYDSFYEKCEIELVLSPYRLVFASRAWYVLGYSDKHGSVRTFKLERLLKLDPLDQLYVQDEPFDVERYFGKAWQIIPDGKIYHVKLLFKPMVAGNVEEVLWHHTQRTRRQRDGSLIFEAEVDGLREIIWWILGYGDQVVVQGPPELRRRVRQMARRMVELYDGQS
ncbi:MAG: helix-turn-helix transcriptional regulator [Phycisphaerae bacterium]